ncbi:NADH-dependent alcohol dehydrogenase [Arcobacter suis]|uniref:Iron-containing alcohol dehydrogenase n=1 Tax=Arcobacter suis CECT 7833 TaxID=663365 RepID=A0AAD0WQ27_9BACT|nr:iron-containing alcohol dehydrogenase [Arcobacter suis]AXX89279.1 iron-containing alcohol dehydrogenase [Arcobacter suis CECT 7833]RWS46512.1 NADH-dependent alcohol dehydrogenase [Arcobacter suis]
MENFSFYNPTKIEFGKEKEKNIGEYIKPFNIKKVLLTFGSDRIKKDGLFDVVIKSLKENNIEYIEFEGITSNPVLSKVYEAIEVAKKEKVDAILSVGGGSVLDSSKAIAAGSLYDGDVWDFFIGKNTVQNALPIFDILTLAATGSEMNCGAVVTNEKTNQKYAIQSAHLYPKVSVINPELMNTVSKDYLVYSAADIIAHCIEGYFTASVQPTFINRQIESIIKTVMETTEKLIENPNNYDARAEFAWASTCALNGLTYIGTKDFSYPNYMIEHILSALYNVPHGAGLSVIMPAWMKWYYSKNSIQFERFANEIFGLYSSQEGIQALENWFNKIGTPTKLSQFGLNESNFEEIIKVGLGNAEYFGVGEIYTKEVFEEILNLAK